MEEAGTKEGVVLRPSEQLHFLLWLLGRLSLICINLQNMELKLCLWPPHSPSSVSTSFLFTVRTGALPLWKGFSAEGATHAFFGDVLFECFSGRRRPATPLASCVMHVTSCSPFGKNGFLICRMGTSFALSGAVCFK